MNQHFYINLKERPEKNAYTITELKKLGIKKPIDLKPLNMK